MTAPTDRFSSPKPTYTPPKDQYNVLTPPKVDHTPSLSISERKVNQRVQELLQQAKILSGQIIADTAEIKHKTAEMKIRYCEAHRLSAKDFVVATRTMTIESKGAYQLLISNGGRKYLDAGFLPAQAFDLLRKEKMSALNKKPNASFDRRPAAVIGKVYQQGTPTKEERIAKIGLHLIKGGKEDDR